jgi:flavorubredoxin
MINLKDGVYWVGAIDWDIKNFHGYITHRGSSYNSYLVISEKIALVDTVKSTFYEDMLRHIKEIIDPSKIDYIIANHAEPDHSGSIKKIINEAPKAKIISSERGKPTLEKYYQDLEIKTIKDHPTLDLGTKTLNFVPVPMAHWPDSMVSYIPEDKLLLSNDAFGQHIATSKRFDDEIDNCLLWQEAATYYANILMPLHRSVGRAINALANVDIDMIAPSHGVIWRKDVAGIITAYNRWVKGETEKQAIIAYDSMWHSTEKIAIAISEGIASEGIKVKVMNLTSNHRSDVMAEILDSKAVLVGSPTLNNHVFPSVAGFLAYMRGLKPMNKIGGAFGSYGWAGGAKRFVEEQMKLAGINLIDNDLDFSYKPSEEELVKSFEYGKTIARKIKEN